MCSVGSQAGERKSARRHWYLETHPAGGERNWCQANTIATTPHTLNTGVLLP